MSNILYEISKGSFEGILSLVVILLSFIFSVFVIFLVITYSKRRVDNYICLNCGFTDIYKKSKGYPIIAILLFIFLFALPGLIYVVWSYVSRHLVCKHCNSVNIAPIDSPVGCKFIENLKTPNNNPPETNYDRFKKPLS
jgi:hypothetical protein